MNHGYGEGIAYFLPNNTNELLYEEELKIKYNDYDSQIPTTKEYKYIFENGNISKYFTALENKLFYQLNFIDSTNLKAIQYILESFRQDEFKGEPTQRTCLVSEQRRILQDSLGSNLLKCIS